LSQTSLNAGVALAWQFFIRLFMKLASKREGVQALLLQDLQSDPFRCSRFGCRARCCSADWVSGPIEAKLKPLILQGKNGKICLFW
jgi:hypothetical protein